jgi:hypothetical protein
VTRRDDLDAVLAGIDGALADPELPDGMRWSPDPEQATATGVPFDGEVVPLPPQRYEAPDRDRCGLPAFPVLPASQLAVRAAAEHEVNLARMREALIVSPEQLDHLAAAWRAVAERIGQTVAEVAEQLAPVRDRLVDAGLVPAPPPADPYERALWARQRRGAGPVRMAQHEHRPRRHR